MRQRSCAAQPLASVSLAEVQIQLLSSARGKAQAHRLLAKYHYLGDVRAVGEQLFYAITGGCSGWLGVLVFCAASRRLRVRDRWINWSEEQRRRRLPLVVNNCRFLLLPHQTFPNLGSRSLRLALQRLSADWQARYAHPVVLVETFVDPEQFCGTVYTANGWQELGLTDGFRRVRRDFYLQHHRAAWGIENGLHQRLDVSHLDDLCRVRQPHSMRVMGLFRRFSNSLFLHWRSRQNKPHHKTITNFFSAMNAEHYRCAIRCLHACQPTFQTAS